MIYVDTSAFYAYLSREDMDHGAVVEAFTSCLEGEQVLVASSYVVAETMGLLQHRLGIPVVERFTRDMLPLVQVRWIAEGEHEAALSVLREVRKRSFTIVDASSVALMRRDGAQRILALDPEFERLGFSTLPPTDAPRGKPKARTR